jgi:hypothetical protein
MDTEFRSIVERLAVLEGRITPTSVKHGLNKQQKSVPQLPALFKPKDISPVLGAKEKKHPMANYMVGDSVENDEEPINDCMGHGGSMGESEVVEDVLGKVKRSLTDYLKNLEDELRVDTDLKDKKPGDSDLKDKIAQTRGLMPKQAVKTVTLEDGSSCEIHGDEDLGFEIRRGNRALKSRFENLDHAEMALEMFNSRLRAHRPMDNQDYIEEK